MKLEYDKDADTAYIYLVHPIGRGQAKSTVQLREDLILDLDSQGKLLGVEILNARKNLSKKALEAAA